MKKLFFALCYVTGLTRLIAWFNRKRVTILCYHNVTMNAEPPPGDEYKQHLPYRLFISHLDYLQKHYTVVSLKDYLAARNEGRALAPYAVVLTFDDGHRNFLTAVAPALAQRSFPATSFIVTNLISATNSSQQGDSWTLADNSAYLSWDEIQTLALSQGLTFGSHTSSHPRLTEIPLAMAERELQDSYSEIIKHLADDGLPLAFPHNQTSPALNNLAKSIGYSCALTADLGLNDMKCDLFSLRRTVIASDDDLATFAARVAGLTCWFHNLRAAFGRRNKELSKRKLSSRSYPTAEKLDYK